jgi:hypothetical protein
MISFKGAHFEKEIILTCVRWYVAYPLSYRQLEEMMQERGVTVDHSTINRWGVVRKKSRGIVRRPSSQGDSRDVNRQGSDGPRRIAVLEAGAGVLVEELAVTRAVTGCLDPAMCGRPVL